MKCGTETPDGVTVCSACEDAARSRPWYETTTYLPEEQKQRPAAPAQDAPSDGEHAAVKSTRMEGFGTALTGAILVTASTLGLSMSAPLTSISPFLLLLPFLGVIAASVAALILGIRTLKTVIRVKKAGGALPIAPMAVAIYAVDFAATMLTVYSFLILYIPVIFASV
jgi:hypothetical protein